MTIPEIVRVVAAVLFGLIAFFALLSIIGRNIIKVPPNMVAVFSGRKRTIVDPETGQRRTVGYRLVKGGSSVRIPIIERVDFLSLNIMTIPLKIASAYTKEGVPVSVDAVANVKIGSDDVMLMNAIERFLGMSQEDIRSVIFQTLEGHLRSILGTLTVEQINADRQAFAQRLAAESAADLSRMGIEIDVLTIQQISDPQGYLDALGQRRTAEVKRDAEVGKAEAERDARVRRAQAMQQAAVAEAMADAEIAAANKEAEVRKARYAAEVEAERARASQAGPLAEARKQVVVAEQRVELARTEAAIAVQEMEARRREKELEATVVKQAQAERQALVIRAEGEKDAAVLGAEGERQATIVRAEAAARERELLGAGEAARIRQVGQAEAEAKKALAEALQAGRSSRRPASRAPGRGGREARPRRGAQRVRTRRDAAPDVPGLRRAVAQDRRGRCPPTHPGRTRRRLRLRRGYRWAQCARTVRDAVACDRATVRRGIQRDDRHRFDDRRARAPRRATDS